MSETTDPTKVTSAEQKAGPLETMLGRYFGNVIFTNLFGMSIWLLLAWTCVELGGTSVKVQISYALAGLIGALLGWASGMYFAPHGSGEHNKFVTLGQAVSAFASGYLVSKIDRFVEATLFPKAGVEAGEWLGAAIFVAAFLNTALVVYSNRSYFLERAKPERESYMNKLSHKGYTGSIEVSIEDNCLHGRVLFIEDIVTYEGKTIDDLATSFKDAVDRYVSDCKNL